MTMKQTTGILLFATGVSAFYAGNINYVSPSLRHPSLGISIPKVAARTYESISWKPEQLNFTHGVASGDPYDDSVILWTRAAPTMDNDHSNTTVSGTTGLFSHETEEFVFFSKSKVCVDWKIATDEKFEEVADEGRVWTSSDIDFTVKVRRAAALGWHAIVDERLTIYFNRSRRRNSARSLRTTISSTFAIPTTSRRSVGPRHSRQGARKFLLISNLPCTRAATIVGLLAGSSGNSANRLVSPGLLQRVWKHGEEGFGRLYCLFG